MEMANMDITRKRSLKDRQVCLELEPEPERRVQPERLARRKQHLGDGETLLLTDISEKKEAYAIPVYGPDGTALPKKFTYITQMSYDDDIAFPAYVSCACGVCKEKTECSCSALNGQYHPYKDGRLNGLWYLLFECHVCNCKKNCRMRGSQRYKAKNLQLFYTGPRKGFGVRSTEFIRKGTCIIEYLGQMKEVTNASEESKYSFDVGGLALLRKKKEGVDYPPSSGTALALEKDKGDPLPDKAFTVDAEKCGNIARFFNHSCDPNLFAQCIVYNSNQVPLSAKLARIVMFASRDINPREEMTVDYNSIGPEKVECQCGSTNCKGFIMF